MEVPSRIHQTTVPWHRSLAIRLGWAFALTIVLSLIVVGIGLISIARQTQRQNVFQLQEQSADKVALLISNYVGNAVQNLIFFEKLESFSTMTPSEQKAALEGLLIQYPTVFSQLTLANRDGIQMVRVSQFHTYMPAELGSLAGSDALITVSRGQTYISPVFVSPDSGLLAMNVAVPVEAPGKQIVNMLLAEVNITRLWQEVARISIGQTGYAYLVDTAGRFIAYQEPAKVLQRYGEDMQHIPPVQEFMTGQVKKASRVYEYAGLTGERVIGLSVPIEGTDWAAVVELPTREAYASVARMQRYLVGLVFLGMIVAIGLGAAVLRRLVRPIRDLTAEAIAIAGGDLSHTAPVPRGKDEITVLAHAFNSMTAQLRELIGTLEQRVAERTQSLEAAAEVARATTSVLDPEVLLSQVVELVRERFDLYYVGAFLLDEEQHFAVLRAGTGEAGQTMLAQGHKLEVGGESMIGQCVAKNQARIALDVGEEPHHFDNPLLPQTRSELALPLRSRGRVIGAITVQSTKPAAFDEAAIAVMQTMADQVAVALDNAFLFAQTQAALATMEATQQRYLGQAWTAYVSARAFSGYEHTGTSLVPLTGELLPEAQRALSAGQTLILDGHLGEKGPDTPSTLVAPILLRNQPLGALGFQQPEDGQPWSSEDIALVEMVAEQFALAADNLRLLDETQRRAAQDRLIREISSRIRESLDVDRVLQTAAREIGQSLALHDLTIQLETDADRAQ